MNLESLAARDSAQYTKVQSLVHTLESAACIKHIFLKIVVKLLSGDRLKREKSYGRNAFVPLKCVVCTVVHDPKMNTVVHDVQCWQLKSDPLSGALTLQRM